MTITCSCTHTYAHRCNTYAVCLKQRWREACQWNQADVSHSAVTSTDNMKRHHSTAAILDSLWCCSAALLLRIKKPSWSFKETNCPFHLTDSKTAIFYIILAAYLTRKRQTKWQQVTKFDQFLYVISRKDQAIWYLFEEAFCFVSRKLFFK